MDDIRAKRARELKVIGWIVLGIILFAMLLGAYHGNNPARGPSATEASKGAKVIPQSRRSFRRQSSCTSNFYWSEAIA